MNHKTNGNKEMDRVQENGIPFHILGLPNIYWEKESVLFL